MRILSLLIFCFSTVFAQSLPPDRKVRKIVANITVPGYDPIRHDFYVMIAKNWEKLGIDVEIAPIDGTEMVNRALKTHEFDVNTLSWGGAAERIDPDYFIFTILDSSQAGKNSYNSDGYNNPE